MFAARQRPLLVLEDRLLALRLSLNTPVLATEELPSGPARALICAWAEGTTRRFAVAVRALRGGNAVVYDLQLDVPADADGWSVALDASLSFGESMGFVFDDEVITDRRPETLRRGVELLRGLLAPGDLEDEAPESVPQLGTGEDLAEILLEDELDALAPGAKADDAGTTGSLAPEPRAERAFGVRVALSKFRSAPATSGAARAEPVSPPVAETRPSAALPPLPAREPRGGATLGRVRPVRVRVDAESGQQADPLLRLLADF
jgi:hypothetical protein